MKKCQFITTLILFLSILGSSLPLRAMDIDEANKRWNLNPIFTQKTVIENDYEIIQKTTSLDNLQRLVKTLIYRNDATHSTTTLAKAMARIDELDQTNKTKTLIPLDKDEGERALSELILNYAKTIDENGISTSTSNVELPRFVTWCITHGVPVTKDAMRAAILEKRIDVVSILRRNGINPQEPCADNKTMNFIDYARNEHRLTIVAILEGKDEEHSIAWHTALQNAANRTEHLDLQVFGGRRAATKNDILDDLSRLGDEKFKEIVSQFNSAEQKEVKTYLETQKPDHYLQKIVYLQQLNPPSFSFSRLKTAAGFIAAAVTATALYQWFSRSPASAQSADVLINNTGNTIFVSDEQHKTITVAAKAVYQLPSQGTLSVKTNENLDEPDLIINLDSYACNRADYYLNISISKNWFSWLFGALRYSVRWTEKLQQ